MENKNYKIVKTHVGSVRFSVENTDHVSREVVLDDSRDFIYLPTDWAIGVFRVPGTYNMYRAGYFTFEQPDEIAKAAAEVGEYFDDPDLIPRPVKYQEDLLNSLKSTTTVSEIEKLCTAANAADIVATIRGHYDEIPYAVLRTVGKTLNIDLTSLDNE